MNPPARVELEGLVVATLACSLPGTVLSSGGSLTARFISFVTVAILHGMIFGLPLFWLLCWRNIANPATCIAGGIALGTLPYAQYFAPGSSALAGAGATATTAQAKR